MPPPSPQDPSTSSTRPSPIPAAAGVGLRHPHIAAFADGVAEATWVEIHSENFFAPGGPRMAQLDRVRKNYPISCHGVGLSLGTAEGLDQDHLRTLCRLVDRIDPILVSEHLSFSVVDNIYVNDLLPLPYTEEALEVVTRNIDQTQEALGRQILLENPSSYLTFTDSTFTECAFLSALVERTGCGLLLDVNNIYVSAQNNGIDAVAYLDGIPGNAVQEIHLAGHMVNGADEDRLLIDTHGDVVADPVWTLYEKTLNKIGPRPTLIEWDTNIPDLNKLLAEAGKAQSRLDAISDNKGSIRVA